MTQYQLSLITLALITALCYYIYSKDRVEKEPVWLLALLFGIGAVCFFPVYYAERFITGLFDSLYADNMSLSLLGVREFDSTGAMLAHSSLCAFIGIALIEEVAKWTVLYFVTRKNKNFNCLFDGVVYSTFISFGFSAAEGLRYAIVDGADMFLSRFVNALSVHLFFGVLIGYVFTYWKTRNTVCRIEREMFERGELTSRKFKRSNVQLIIGLGASVLIHGFFVVSTYIESDIAEIVTAVVSIVLYVLGFVGVKYLSSVDGSIENKAKGVIEKCHRGNQHS